MSVESSGKENVFGFVSVIRSAEHGLFGGYLVLNGQGRPLEFHCTAPVQANRAQEILYGTTLDPFLCGEQIGHTLLTAAQRTPVVVCTSELPVLALQPLASMPVVWVSRYQVPGAQVSAGRADLLRQLDETEQSVLPTLGEVHPFDLAGHVLLVMESMQEHVAGIQGQLDPLLELIELQEPFSRIQEAIEEAHRTALGDRRHRQAG